MYKMALVAYFGDNVLGRHIARKKILFFTHLHCTWVFVSMFTCLWSYNYACSLGSLNLKSIYILYCYLYEQQLC